MASCADRAARGPSRDCGETCVGPERPRAILVAKTVGNEAKGRGAAEPSRAAWY